ncbi:hypothetical protein K432DRAFT_398604 [Lepidopterella palustris CBS 459.81]|uniref:Uncharacterized protein n=1 Tax=Lepidopterella palustris CBS 459.81 TaxID=1314670 RepID=A0A8E2J930_9PEZI|nr:hypothetical protein K432DRAFT_398604 [Lepidopterella palustris CBS 459.81]
MESYFAYKFAAAWTPDICVPPIEARYACKNYNEQDPFDQALHLERFHTIANRDENEIRQNIISWTRENYGYGPANTLLEPQFKCILDLGRKIEEALLSGDLEMENIKEWPYWQKCGLWLEKMVKIRKSIEHKWELGWEKVAEEERRVEGKK